MNICRTAFAVLAGALLVAGCASEEPQDEAQSVTVREAWIKAAAIGMTSAFAEIQNTGDEQVRVVAASTDSSSMMELHEVVASADGSMVMKPKEGGFAVAADDTKVLQAGGDHLMLMDVTSPLTPGVDTDITLTFEDGSSTTFTAQVREFAGAEENYGG